MKDDGGMRGRECLLEFRMLIKAQRENQARKVTMLRGEQKEMTRDRMVQLRQIVKNQKTKPRKPHRTLQAKQHHQSETEDVSWHLIPLVAKAPKLEKLSAFTLESEPQGRPRAGRANVVNTNH